MADAAPKKSRAGIAISVLLALALIGAGIWLLNNRKDTAGNVPEAAAAANARGVGYLEQFDTKQDDGETGYEKARKEFTEALRLAPNWTTAKIHLALALLYTAEDPKIDKAKALFSEIATAEPGNAHAQFGLGIIHHYRAEPDLANPHFAKVTEVDPQDAYAWYFRAMTTSDSADSPQAKEFFEKAVALDPYLTSARFSIANHSLTDDPETRKKLHAENDALKAGLWARNAEVKPTKLGRYGAPIGAILPPPGLSPLPKFEPAELAVKLATNTKWAATVDGDAKAVRERFGGTMVRLDYNGDGKLDLLLLFAVIRDGKRGDLLLRNDGGSFTDVSTDAGLAGHASHGCAVADFDNSGTPDLALTSPTGVRLLRNVDGKFADVTKDAGLDKAAGSFLSAAWIDIDQDGDLDLLLVKQQGGVLVFLNVGEAPPGPPGEAKPLSAKFQPFEHPAFTVAGRVDGFLLTDVDADGDVDIIALEDGKPPVVILNDRLLRFRRGSEIVDERAFWTGGTTIDVNADGQSDLVLISPEKTLAFVTTDDRVGTDTKGRFKTLVADLPILLQAQAIDLDHDGRTDIVGLSADRKPVLVRGEGSLKTAANPFGDLADLIAVAAGDFDGDCDNDVIGWAPDGLKFLRNAGNGNKGLKVQLTGVRQAQVARTNRDGFGAKATMLAGTRSTLIENTTRSAGLGQSLVPLDFGVGPNNSADALRIAWPDMIPQAEVNLPTCELRLVRETDRRPDSCPVLFTWDGEKYRYVTDLLGEGTMGELNATGGTRPPRPEESVKIEADQLKPKDGKYRLKLAEPMNEILYLDSLRLDAVDHPAGVEVYPDERFAAGASPPTQKLLAFRSWYSPASARDHRGRDVTATLKERDGQFVDTFARRLWLGLAEEHTVELNFGDQLETIPKDSNLFLVLSGWTDYAYPETLFAATQAGVTPLAPTLEKKVGDGPWQPVGEIGFPAGLPRTMTSPVTGLAGSKRLKLRIRTNMHVFWDQIRLGVAESGEPNFQKMVVAKATLARRGFAKEIRRGSGPAAYDDATLERVAYTKWRGKLTKLGDVTKLLTTTDDHFAILGPGDEVEVEFDATLPPPPNGTVRSFVLRSHGYCKDSAPFTATTGDIHPLPFRAMASYPDGARDRSKAPNGQDEYDRTWNTRPVGR
ncbi:MAG: VCBS repeat-containing protein [Gemmataceae bacterium]|nr:VCBS repeat-containing protein [Gemmataceae bacterium]